MFKRLNQRSVSLNDVTDSVWCSVMREEEREIQMESTEARSDFVSLYLELCPEAIVAYITKMLALSSISGGGKKNPNQTPTP